MRRIGSTAIAVAVGSALLVAGCTLWLALSGSSAASLQQHSAQRFGNQVRGGDQATTAVVPSQVSTLYVGFRSKGQGGSKQRTVWDGRVEVSGAVLQQIRLWQPDPRNQIQGNSWQLTTRHEIPWNAEQRRRGHQAMPLQDGALLVELANVSPSAQVEFTTEQGNFTVSLQEVPFGVRKTFLGGLVEVARAATTGTILSAPTEDDFPSAAMGSDGKLHVAYVAFTHGERFRVREQLDKPPADLGCLAEPPGGDQVLLLTGDGDRWTGPMPVTAPGQDVFRTAVAVGGAGDVWVFWSANDGGNWDLYARRFQAGKPGRIIRLTDDAGPDLFPAATTDSQGRVWVAWQGFRNGQSNIFAARSEGERFGEAMAVCAAPGNQWTPAVAAAGDGRLAVAWDSYENGNYDVFARIWSGGGFGERITVANSLRAEMRPSIVFDPAGRLWIAYEDSPEKWGKDWGALEKEGVALYQGRTVAVRVWAEGQLWEPADHPMNAFYPMLRGSQAAGGGQKAAMPRLCADSSGRIWLAVRSSRLGTRTNVGTTWFEHVAFYQGDRWSNEIVCPGTDNLLDQRAALVPAADGRLLMVLAADNRWATAARLPQWFLRELRESGEKVEQGVVESKWPDAVNNELVMAVIGPLDGSAASPTLARVDLPAQLPGNPGAEKESAEVAAARRARVTIAGKTLRLWRGEFHRHTEISSDGGGDGALMDMWRYGIDAAAMDWIGNGDHDNGGGREYSWWITQKTSDAFHIAGTFTPMFTYERSCNYPDGHRNVLFAQRGVRTLPRLQGGMGKAMDELPAEAERPNTPDTQMLYRYLAHFDGLCASHTSGTDMGTDWRDNDAKVEPIVEIYQGCRQNYEMPGAPRANTAEYSIGGWRPYGFVSLALMKGHRLGFQASSDHVSTHISYCNVWVEEPTRQAILAAMKARHVYGATDNIVADVRCGDHFMGDEFTTQDKPRLSVHLIGTAPLARVHVIKDNQYVHTFEPGKQQVRFEWTDLQPAPGKTSYYYVRGEQADGELVWVSPMWITYKP